MKNRTVLLLATAALLAGAVEAGKGVIEGNEASAAASVAAQETPEQKLAALIQRHDEKRKAVIAAYGEAETDAEREKIIAGLPGKDFAAEFRALAEDAPGTETAARAWLWFLKLVGDPKQAWTGVETLLADHMQSEALAELPGHLRAAARIRGEDVVVEALHGIVEESPHEKVRASALYVLGQVLIASKDGERKQEGRRCFETVAAEYGKVSYGMDSTYRAAAERFLYELDHLQIGMPAPDFETVDENGVAWKLSDYKGKVVVVDFWGFW